MKTMIQMLVVGLLCGGLSVGATMFLQKNSATTAAGSTNNEKPDPTKPDPDKNGAEHPDHADAPLEPEHATVVDHQAKAPATPIAAVRPPFDSDADQASELMKALRKRNNEDTEMQRKIAERMDAIKMIYEDLQSESRKTITLRRQMTKEIQQSSQVFEATRKEIDQQRSQLDKERKDSQHALDDAKKLVEDQKQREEERLQEMKNLLEDYKRKELERSEEESKKAAEQQRTQNQGAKDQQGANSTGAKPKSNSKNFAKILKSLEPVKVARFIELMESGENSGQSIGFLTSMEPEQAAEVLDEIEKSKPELAMSLMLQLKEQKTQ